MEPEVVSDQTIEANLAAAFERESSPPKERPEPRETAQDDEPVAQAEEAAADAESTEEGEEAPQDDGYEEAEFEGETYRLPPKLKDALLRQKDYTQKAQEAAETRRFATEEREALQIERAFQQQHFDKAVEAHGLQQRLQQFAQVNWDKLADENPSECMKLHAQHVATQQRFAGLRDEMQGLQGQLNQKLGEARQKAQAQCIQELKRDFPDLASPEKGSVLLKHLNETGLSYGFTARELEGIADPRMVRVLHAAMQWKKLQASKSVVEKKVQTAKPVQVTASRASQTTQHNAKYQDLKGRAIKSGKASDAERFLEAAFTRKR